VPDRRYTDRSDAGRRLAEALRGIVAPDAVVVGLARGGAPVAACVADALGLTFDVLAVRKIGHPAQPEYAIGAIAPGGPAYVRDPAGVTQHDLERGVERVAADAARLDAALHVERAHPDLAGRACVLVDDGLATGATMVAAARWARSAGARTVVVAVPVGAAESLAALASEVDAVVCPLAPARFGAVGAWYDDFAPVEESEVLALLRSG
jgi:putative phosphoribosyl transferase